MEIRPLTNKECKSSRFRHLEDLLSFYVDNEFILDKTTIKLGAFEENRLIGFALGYRHPYSNIVPTYSLSFLVVRKEYQGIGVGKKLVVTFENKIRAKGITVEIQVGTMWYYGVRRFYRRMGYKLLEADKQYRCSTYRKYLT